MGGSGRLFCVVALSAAVPTAVAQQLDCTQRSKFVHHLKATYAEKSVAIGVTDNGSVVELLNSKTGDSWTIITTPPDGIACIVASGKHWQILPRDESQDH